MDIANLHHKNVRVVFQQNMIKWRARFILLSIPRNEITKRKLVHTDLFPA